MPQFGSVASHLMDAFDVSGVLDDGGDGTGVLQDPTDLIGRGGFVNRDGGGADPQDREVQDRPFVTRLGKEGHPITRIDTGRNESFGDVKNLFVKVADGDVAPRAVSISCEGDGIGVDRESVAHIVGEITQVSHVRQATVSAER